MGIADRKQFVCHRGGYCAKCLEVFSQPKESHLLPTHLWRLCAGCYGGRRVSNQLSKEYVYYTTFVNELAALALQSGSAHYIRLAQDERVRCFGAEWYAHFSANTVDASTEAREARWGKLTDADRNAAWRVR